MAAWSNYPNGVLFSPSTSYPNYDEPIQGGAPNCSCIAGMSSLAWVYPFIIKQNMAMNQVIFPAAGAIQQDAQIWLDSGNFVYARDLFSPAPSNEIWPSLLEKGYAKLIQGTASGAQPNMAAANWNNFSLAPLVSMTGWNADVTNIGAGLDVASKLGSYCWWSNNSAQTKFPGIAWTANAAGTNPGGQIFQNHSYSILGLYNDAAGQIWVILRDPKRTGAPAGALTIGTWTLSHANYYRGSGPYNSANILVPLINGTFGITTDSFKALFAGFGFVR